MLTAKNQTTNSGTNIIVIVMYAALVFYFLYKTFKAKRAAKNAQGQAVKFRKTMSTPMKVLIGLVLGFAGLSISQGLIINGIVMLSLLAAVFIESTSPYIFAENGLVANSEWINWKEIKKWTFEDSGELVINYKSGFEEKTGYLRLAPSQKDEVQGLFRKYKLNK